MSKVVTKKTSPRQRTRVKRKARFRKKLASSGSQRPRLIVFRSNRFLYAQVIDDGAGKTLAQANSGEKSFPAGGSKKGMEAAKTVGKLVAERFKTLKDREPRVVFDRNGYDYHGRVKALADGAREAGLEF